MFDALDIRTLSLTNLIFSFVFGLGLVVYAYNHKKFEGIATIGWGFLYLALGFLLLGLRQYIHDFISIVIANTLIVTSMMMIYHGLIQFRQVKLITPVYWYPLAILVTFATFIYLTFFEPNVNARVIVISTLIALQSLLISYALLYRPNQPTGMANSLLGVLFLGFAVISIIRMLVTLGQNPLEDFMQASLVHGISLLAIEVMVMFTSFSVIWIASSILEKELMNQAREDPLTALFNRRALDEQAHIELSRARRNQHTLAIVICDIDYFKHCNDTYGHQAGDIVLQEFANLLKHHIREHDIVARFGGEEFLILLPETTLEQGAQLAEKLRIKVKQLTIAVAKKKVIGVTASFGVTATSDTIYDWHTLVKTADSALYQAKSAGRDRVHTLAASDLDTLAELPASK